MKRHISILLLASMLLSFVACADSDTGLQDTTQNSNNDTSAAETDLYDAIPKKDYNGEEIRIYSYNTSGSYHESEFMIAEQTGDTIDDAIYKRNILTEERLNIHLNYFGEDNENEARTKFISSMLAGDDFCDILVHKAAHFSAFLTSETILPWNDINGIDLSQPWYVHFINDCITIGNQQYGILSDAWATSLTMAYTIAFNKRLADDWKIDDPYQLVRDGNWTMDTMISLTKDIWRDINGDNIRDAGDEYGFYTNSQTTLDCFIVAHNIESIGKDENDLPIVNFYSDKLVKSFEKVYELYWENSGTFTDKNWDGYIETGFVSGLGLFSPMRIDHFISNKLREMEDDYGILPYPKLDENQSEYRTYLLSRPGVAMVPITISDDKLDMIGYTLETLSAYSYHYLRPAIYDVTLSGKSVRDEESLEMLDLIMDSRCFDFSQFVEFEGKYPLNPQKTYRDMLGNKNDAITTYYESNKNIAEEYVNSLREMFE